MYEFTVKHNYCGMERTIRAESIAQAYRNYGLNYQVWTVIAIEKIA